MLVYSRTKSVGVQKQSDTHRVVSGVLEDELYAMQLEILINWPERTIENLQCFMKRFTTKRCPLAEKVFERAVGWKIDTGLDSRIKKELGRYGCRHMAILMVDCCRAVAVAELADELARALEEDPELDRQKFLEEFLERHSDLKDYMRLQ